MFDLIRSIFSYSIQPRVWMICVLWTFQQDVMAELQWDLTTVKTEAAFGSEQASMTFTFSNPTAASINIESLEIHCGCVKVRHTELPWTISPGTMHSLTVDLNIRGKKGLFHQDFGLLGPLELDLLPFLHLILPIQEKGYSIFFYLVQFLYPF